MGHESGSGYYPVMLDLSGQRCLVVGGGEVAVRKVKGLVEAGASVTVVAPMIDGRLRQMGGLEVRERTFRTTDLHGMTLAIVATDDAVLNRTVARDARDLGVLVNVVDCPAMCTFILPATLRRGPVQVSVSTGGTSPSLARKLRDMLQESIGAEYGELAGLLGELRGEVMERVADGEVRARLFEQLSGEEFLGLVREGKIDQARERMRKLLEKEAGESPQSHREQP